MNWETGLVLLAAILLPVLVLGMLPMQAVRLRLGALLAADTMSLAPVLANKLAVIVAPFTEAETLQYSDLTLASTNGLSPIALATGSQEVAIDPVSQAQILTLVPGAGTGFRWVTSGTFPPSITVYGFALIDNAGATLLGVVTLATPIVLSATGYQVEADPQMMTFVLQPLS